MSLWDLVLKILVLISILQIASAISAHASVHNEAFPRALLEALAKLFISDEWIWVASIVKCPTGDTLKEPDIQICATPALLKSRPWKVPQARHPKSQVTSVNLGH